MTDGNLKWAVYANPLLTALMLLGLTTGVVLATGVLEQFRMIVFKLTGIDKLMKKIGNKIDSVIIVEV